MRTCLTIVLVTSAVAAFIVLLATTPMVYATGDEYGNRNKAKDNSQAALADCDYNEVEKAGFKCKAVALDEFETATLTVCKVIQGPNTEFPFTVTGNNPSPSIFGLFDDDCQDVTIGPGDYTVIEGDPLNPTPTISSDSDCTQDPDNLFMATGEIQTGETQTCTFVNFIID